jgi:alkanesulfonate monooxygenase
VRFSYDNEAVEFFFVHPRSMQPETYWPHIANVIQWSEQYGATGILLFEGNDTLVQPWLAAFETFSRTQRLCPLVAVNPVYMHPFTAAKMVTSNAYLFGRRTYLNLITGTALSYLDALGDGLDKEQRYDRLREYAELITLLTTSNGQPVTYSGQYYTLKNAKLQPGVPAGMEPIFFVAGQSEAALATSRAIGAVHMQMLPAQLELGLAAESLGVHFGIVARETEAEAWAAAREAFPDDALGRRIQAYSMKNTDSTWKQRMMLAAKMETGARPGYWLEPFRHSQADCPYFVGSRSQVAEMLANLIRAGMRHIILDVPHVEREFAEAKAVSQETQAMLATDAGPLGAKQLADEISATGPPLLPSTL